MINENFKIEKKEGTEYPPLPENIYQVELLDIELQVKPKYKKENETEKVFSFQFTLLNGKEKDGSSLRGRNIWRNFVPTYLYIGNKGKNILYQIVEAIIGMELSPEIEATLDAEKLNKLIGRQARIVVKNTKKDDKTYSNIDTFLPIEAPLTALTAEEKEQARVKNKEEEQTHAEPHEEEIQVENIPF